MKRQQKLWYNVLSKNKNRVWLSLVEYSVWGGGVEGSNPSTRTNRGVAQLV